MSKLTLAYWCVLAVAFMPFLCAGISKWGGASGYNNAQPRDWYQQLSGYRARAAAAQANCWEAFPFFAAAVIIAHQLQAPQAMLNGLALGFIVLRFIYVALYLSNKPSLRSAIWTAAIALNVWIFLLGA
jgi:uncharacterized MAPEG superfamily protein